MPGGSGNPTGSAGLIDINHASAEELDTLPGIGPVTAAKIIDARTQAPFATIDELQSRGVVGPIDVRQVARPDHGHSLTRAAHRLGGYRRRHRRALRGGRRRSAAVLMGAAAAAATLPCSAVGSRSPSRRRGGDGRRRLSDLVPRCVGGLIAAPPTAAASRRRLGSKHTGLVISVGTPDGGQQRAVVELQAPEPAVTAYVWLPRYPQVVPEDLIPLTAVSSCHRRMGTSRTTWLGAGSISRTRREQWSVWAPVTHR